MTQNTSVTLGILLSTPLTCLTLLCFAGEAELTLLFASLQHLLTAFAFIALHRFEAAARGIALQCGEYELQLIQEGREWLTS